MNAELYQYTLPLRHPLTQKGKTITERTGLLLKLIDEDGAVGWGDAAPLPGFSRETLEQCIDSFFGFAESIRNREYFEVFQERAHLSSENKEVLPSVSFAIESALQAILGHEDEFNTSASSIELSALLSGDAESILKKARTLRERKIRCAKLKVGRGEVQDEAGLVVSVSKILGTECLLRLDANRAWSLEEAKIFAKAISGISIEYIEEPLRNPDELDSFHATTGMPYALDETLYEMPPPTMAKEVLNILLGERRALWFNAAAWVWKPTLLHVPMLGPALQGLVQDEFGPKLVISAAFESGVGIAALVKYAASCMDSDVAAGLDTYAWLEEDVLLSPLPLSGGHADVPAICTLAGQIDMSRLEPIPMPPGCHGGIR
ncbi:MAG TPA: o-succinylbenzoate synthase [Candidatus Hydrogenedentes bacterium]|nr:o-succinylbenzoate synthase [Candidatus Hydrogenedentota bacterium]